ncbi:hypothetical protein TanjilG_04560 [Lupinus angustifolius]|uniref:Uncharacterized protein n=1 Tax=Lupinus angustifolius TaxID=3871 RepID=A0A4P1RQU3_LUPAN|nr:PREDICTED: uncharacterized protein LOC109343038 [Lupinus angustifolius]OIW16025.1 hypothetical protein TanjilG_04560 [Lupinus angustifolius]
MNANLLRNVSFCARHFRFSPFNSTSSIPTLSASTRLFSSTNIPSNQPQFSNTQKKNESVDVDDISDEELKRRVAKLQEGDVDAIPSVFEAILQRYLTGKPIEDDQELMREILGKGTVSEDEDDELDSDLEGMSDTDDEDGNSDVDFGRNNVRQTNK